LPLFEKYHPSGNLKYNNLGIFQSLKLCNLMGKILRVSLKRNFTRNTLGCYGLMLDTWKIIGNDDIVSRQDFLTHGQGNIFKIYLW